MRTAATPARPSSPSTTSRAERRARALLRRHRHATFSIGGEDVDAPAGTCVWVTDADAVRTATANDDDTLVLAIGAARPGEAYTPEGWEAQYLDDES